MQRREISYTCFGYVIDERTNGSDFKEGQVPDTRPRESLVIFRNAAGELAPMRFRRLPGVTGPCPSTTLDKSFIHFLLYFIGKMDVCQ